MFCVSLLRPSICGIIMANCGAASFKLTEKAQCLWANKFMVFIRCLFSVGISRVFTCVLSVLLEWNELRKNIEIYHKNSL